MAKKAAFTEQNLLDKGYSLQPDGTYRVSRTSLASAKIDKIENLIAKEIIKKSPDFTATPTTSWFIKGYNVPSKKNSRQNFVRNSKQVSIPSKLHAAYVKATAMQYDVFGREFRAAVEHYKLGYPLYVEFHFIRGSRHSFDYCNAAQTCEGSSTSIPNSAHSTSTRSTNSANSFSDSSVRLLTFLISYRSFLICTCTT